MPRSKGCEALAYRGFVLRHCGSGPGYLFTEVLGAPVVTLPLANFDNNQHAANENLRLGNLWDGIEMYAGLLVRLGKEWRGNVVP